MIKYAWFPEIKYDSEAGHYHTYGIAAYSHGQRRMISDVSVEKDKIRSLVSAFNADQIELEHVDEAIESFLYDFEV